MGNRDVLTVASQERATTPISTPSPVITVRRSWSVGSIQFVSESRLPDSQPGSAGSAAVMPCGFVKVASASLRSARATLRSEWPEVSQYRAVENGPLKDVNQIDFNRKRRSAWKRKLC